MKQEKLIVFIDGQCSICNKLSLFVHKHDKQNQFLFSTLNSKFAEETLAQYDSDSFRNLDSIVLLDKQGITYTHSDAVIQIGQRLNKYKFISLLIKVFPKIIRDGLYKIFASHRHLFGKMDSCEIPDRELIKKQK